MSKIPILKNSEFRNIPILKFSEFRNFLNVLKFKLEIRNSIFPSQKRKKLVEIERKISTMDIFLGRTNLIIFNAPNPNDPTGIKHFIDVRYLVQQAENILKSGSPTPIFRMSSLEKLALGLRESLQNSKTTTISKVGKDETLAFWQSDMIKIQMIKGIWRVWSRLNRLATSMRARRREICRDNMIMIDLKEESVVFHLSKTQIDVSWQSNYNVEQLKLKEFTSEEQKQS
ncbi:Protein CBG01354 [Caenorhabditis briggsae]|uniref:Protein CBG01354 n=1 Tax=Caenorhabditis briggsae TaxID=6238 RepID=A8WQ79_CAEBR|nr:Protein CBG01354 [Caenorhabditis briggsae]CAP22637.2 Protein CBG01354 [Caenorhabditis briggsae]